MRFKDERQLWYSEVEDLSEMLANKTAEEVNLILDDADVIRLQSSEQPKAGIPSRLFGVVLWPIFVLILCVKWLICGDRYLDSWGRKSKTFDWFLEFARFR